jgi:hypothetical protein
MRRHGALSRWGNRKWNTLEFMVRSSVDAHLTLLLARRAKNWPDFAETIYLVLLFKSAPSPSRFARAAAYTDAKIANG